MNVPATINRITFLFVVTRHVEHTWSAVGTHKKIQERASIHDAADDVLDTGFLSDDTLACFEEVLGDQLPEMGTDKAAARREAIAGG